MSISIGRNCAQLVGFSVLVSALAVSAPAQTGPNFVFVLLDDLGWRDFSSYGSDFYETPHIDALAREGMRFTQFYSSGSVCSPTRSALVTGKHPARTHNTQWFGGATNGTPYVDSLALEEHTLGEAFHGAGYVTGHIGKWHLGPRLLPTRHGFATNVAGTGAGHPYSYFSPYRNAHLPDGPAGEYLTDRLAEEAVKFIEANRTSPFFLLLSHYSPHTPLQAKADLIAKYHAKAGHLDTAGSFGMEGTNKVRLKQNHAVYAAMIESVDQGIGRILAKLREVGLDSQTVVIVTSDNGGLSTSEGHPTANAPLRAGKGWLYEGGIRVPFIARWPGRIEAGKIADSVAATTDLYPTLLKLAGLPLRPDQHRDGTGFADLLLAGGPASPRGPLFWHYPHNSNQGGKPGSAMRLGRYKLIEFFATRKLELYDLAEDPGERNDLSQTQRQRTAELFASLKAWRDSVNANMPATYQIPVGLARVSASKRPLPGKSAGAVFTAQGRQVPETTAPATVTLP